MITNMHNEIKQTLCGWNLDNKLLLTAGVNEKAHYPEMCPDTDVNARRKWGLNMVNDQDLTPCLSSFRLLLIT